MPVGTDSFHTKAVSLKVDGGNIYISFIPNHESMSHAVSETYSAYPPFFA